MRVLFVLGIMISSLSAFAIDKSEFLDMKIRDIYDRGYAIKATVAQSPGILIAANKRFIRAYGDGAVAACYLKLKERQSRETLLKAGREFLLVRLGGSLNAPLFPFTYNDGLYLDDDSKIVGLDYVGTPSTKYSFLKDKCDKLDFEIVENPVLEDL